MNSGLRDTIRVLHVEDDPDFGELTATILEREDDRFALERATSATDGNAHLEERQFDCVVSDYDMPGTHGIEFLTFVREQYPELPFILFTGKGSEEVASDATSAGVTDSLQKEGGTDQYAVLANRITNVAEHGGDAVTVTVGDLSDGFHLEDDGPGIPADARADVFEGGYSTATGGTGFG